MVFGATMCLQVIGEPVVYGQVVQLRHVATGRFLTIRRTAADVERGALKVSSAGEGGCFISSCCTTGSKHACLMPLRRPGVVRGAAALQRRIPAWVAPDFFP